jgi:hypothetical protein
MPVRENPEAVQGSDGHENEDHTAPENRYPHTRVNPNRLQVLICRRFCVGESIQEQQTSPAFNKQAATGSTAIT